MIEHRAGTRQGNADGVSRRPYGSRRCTRTDCLEGTCDGGMQERSESAADREPPVMTVAESNKDPLPETSGLEYHCRVQKSDGSGNSEALTLENIRRHQENDLVLRNIKRLLEADANTDSWEPVEASDMSTRHL